MRRLRLSIITALFLTGAAVSAQDTKGALAPLQGRWVVTAGEHNGKPLDVIKGGVMTVSADAFEVRTASGNVLKGTLRLDPSKKPAHMDMLHADGEKWEAIYEASGETFRINYVEAGGTDPRPAAFTTAATTEETLIAMRREGR